MSAGQSTSCAKRITWPSSCSTNCRRKFLRRSGGCRRTNLPCSSHSSVRREPFDGGVRFFGKCRNEIRGLHPPRHADALPGPQRQKFGAALFRGSGAQRTRQRVLQREGKDRKLLRPP